jgi:pyruvate/2-oxoglutarate dehydrogenase complex dihydrolipoamide acyltransferase (E2) component
LRPGGASAKLTRAMPLFPIFRRADGDVVRGLSPVRRMMPYLMPTRNESVVYYEQILDATALTAFIQRWNDTHEHKITPFHCVMASLARALHARPGLNRFVSGRRIYQRRGVQLSFAAKRAFADDAPLVTVKMEVPAGEPFEETVRRIHAAVGEGRSDRERPVDKEVRLAVMLPSFVLGAVLSIMRALDRWNLLPGFVTKNDPMYASIFVANLGSVGIDRVWHHLYEYGTVSHFCVIGGIRPRVVPGADGKPVVRDTLRLRFSFDERINDGFYCASSLALVRDDLENPERLLQPLDPKALPARRVNAATSSV